MSLFVYLQQNKKGENVCARMSRFVFLKTGRREKMAGRMLRQHAGDDNDYVLRIALIEQVCKRESEGEEREREKIHVVC